MILEVEIEKSIARVLSDAVPDVAITITNKASAPGLYHPVASKEIILCFINETYSAFINENNTLKSRQLRFYVVYYEQNLLDSQALEINVEKIRNALMSVKAVAGVTADATLEVILSLTNVARLPVGYVATDLDGFIFTLESNKLVRID